MQSSQSEIFSYTIPYKISLVMRPRLSITASKKSIHIYPYDTMDILRCFKWETWGRVVDRAKDTWEKATFYWIFLARMHQLESIFKFVWHEK